MIFQNTQSLTMPILVQMRGPQCGQRRIRRLRTVKTEEKKCFKRTMRACGWQNPRVCIKKSGKKIRIDFSPIYDELTVNQVSRGRFVHLQVSEIKRKANEAQMREEFISIPQYGRQSVCTLFVDV